VQTQIRPTSEEVDQIAKRECAKPVICVVLLVSHEDGEFVHQNGGEQIAAVNVG
jgi:hypothetical protein